MQNHVLNLSAASLLQQLEAGSILVRAIIEDALQANTLETIQALLWQFETRLRGELEIAAELWPLEKWAGDNQRACKWIHAASLAIQMAYRETERRQPAA